jgi:hypothetical protein
MTTLSKIAAVQCHTDKMHEYHKEIVLIPTTGRPVGINLRFTIWKLHGHARATGGEACEAIHNSVDIHYTSSSLLSKTTMNTSLPLPPYLEPLPESDPQWAALNSSAYGEPTHTAKHVHDS